jgi:hypothetical protein
MGALDRFAGPVRAKPWMAAALAVALLLVAAWISWAVYVASDRGLNEGIGVLIAWPALLAAAVVVCLPFIGIYLLIRPREVAAEGQASPTKERPKRDTEEARATETR